MLGDSFRLGETQGERGPLRAFTPEGHRGRRVVLSASIGV